MALSTKSAVSVESVENSIGVNTHLEMAGFGYQDLATTEASINYLGINNLRDSANIAGDLGSSGIWQKVANATGAKFDVYLVRGSESADVRGLSYAKTLASQGIVNMIEGVDEADLAGSYGNNLSWAANFQKTVYATAHAMGVKVVNMSFGGGWTWLNNWQGNYASQGNLSAYADYANAHTYPSVGQTVDVAMQRINGLAKLAASSRPVVTTEIGWNESQYSQAAIAKYTLDAVFDGIKNGDVKTYFYSLYNDKSGNYGLMNADGTPKPAGKALHNLSVILADSGTPKAGTLSYSLTGTTSADNSVLMEKSTGVFDLAVWNESGASHSVTLTLASAADTIKVYDPLSSSTATQTYSGKSTVSFTVPDHPVIVEINNTGNSESTPVTPPSSGSSYTVASNQTLKITGGTNKITVSGSNATVTATAGTNTYTVSGAHDVITGGTGVDTSTSTNSYNTFKGGGGSDTITFAGSHNTVYAGGGDKLTDNGSTNRIAFGAVASGVAAAQIYGSVLKNGDTLDLRTTLANTNWTGSTSTLSKFLKVTMSGTNAIISVDPTGVAGATSYQLAVLHNTGTMSLSTVLAHSIT